MSGVNVECFSCSGGMAEGFRRAGITFNYVFDRDPNAVASYTRNLGHAPVQMDVRHPARHSPPREPTAAAMRQCGPPRHDQRRSVVQWPATAMARAAQKGAA